MNKQTNTPPCFKCLFTDTHGNSTATCAWMQPIWHLHCSTSWLPCSLEHQTTLSTTLGVVCGGVGGHVILKSEIIQLMNRKYFNILWQKFDISHFTKKCRKCINGECERDTWLQYEGWNRKAENWKQNFLVWPQLGISKPGNSTNRHS